MLAAFLIQNPSVAVTLLHGVVQRLREVQNRMHGGDRRPPKISTCEIWR
jgi:hypothetical protein